MLARDTALSRREAVMGAAMMATAAATWALLPRREVIAVARRDIGGTIPTRVDTWGPGPDLDLVKPPEDEQAAASVYEDQVARIYVRDGFPPVMFLLAYDRRQSGMLMVHRPESCYPGSGFTINADNPSTIPLANGLKPNGRFLSTQRDDRIEQVLYWTRLGNEFPNSWDQERWFLARQNLRGLAPDGALIRLSTVNSDANDARELLTRFAAALYAACGREGRALLSGPASVSSGTA